VQPALERVCRSLGELGFHAALESVTPTEAVIRSATCPLRPLVTSDAEARAIDQGMWRGLIATALDRHRADSVVCQTEGCDDHDAPCRIIVRLATHA
jgi:hypothetical protein